VTTGSRKVPVGWSLWPGIGYQGAPCPLPRSGGALSSPLLVGPSPNSRPWPRRPLRSNELRRHAPLPGRLVKAVEQGGDEPSDLPTPPRRNTQLTSNQPVKPRLQDTTGNQETDPAANPETNPTAAPISGRSVPIQPHREVETQPPRIGDRNLQGRRAALTECDRPRTSRGRALPPLRADVGSMLIKTLAMQIWLFCTVTASGAGIAGPHSGAPG
jgi:hypothetical protein